MHMAAIAIHFNCMLCVYMRGTALWHVVGLAVLCLRPWECPSPSLVVMLTTPLSTAMTVTVALILFSMDR